MPHQLPPLPYDSDALEPFIDARTMELHHGKHHAAYVDALNEALEDHPSLHELTVEQLLAHLPELPESIRTVVRNQGGGHYNHSLFWTVMKKDGGGEPEGNLALALGETFGSADGFRATFSKAALESFGSGWTWLTFQQGKLAVSSTANHDCPISLGARPLLVLDTWEHAYYLKYENRRKDFIEAWWNVVDWARMAESFDRAIMAKAARGAA